MEEHERTFGKVQYLDPKGHNSEMFVCSVWREKTIETILNTEKYLNSGPIKKEGVYVVQIAWSESETNGCDRIQW